MLYTRTWLSLQSVSVKRYTLVPGCNAILPESFPAGGAARGRPRDPVHVEGLGVWLGKRCGSGMLNRSRNHPGGQTPPSPPLSHAPPSSANPLPSPCNPRPTPLRPSKEEVATSPLPRDTDKGGSRSVKHRETLQALQYFAVLLAASALLRHEEVWATGRSHNGGDVARRLQGRCRNLHLQEHGCHMCFSSEPCTLVSPQAVRLHLVIHLHPHLLLLRLVADLRLAREPDLDRTTAWSRDAVPSTRCSNTGSSYGSFACHLNVPGLCRLYLERAALPLPRRFL